MAVWNVEWSVGGGNGGGVVGRGIFLVCGSSEVVITTELGGILVCGIEKLGTSGLYMDIRFISYLRLTLLPLAIVELVA